MQNPYVPSGDPCESNSGSAISVAANMVAVSLGTETDGSIICPADVNSVVGFKPTIGLTSRVGCGPSPDPPDRRDSLLKEKKEMKKLVFSSFEKPAPDEERCCLESPLTFYFCF